jgi:triacylglycerol lipase
MEKLKYPVMLVHGIVAHDRWKLYNFFWGRIPEVFRKNGIKVYFGNTDAWGSCASNARILKNTIEKVLQETGAEKVNIISHSKGGLDSRYLICKRNFADKVASLTTICTPHMGAELADLIYDKLIVYNKAVKKTLKIFGKLYGDINPNLHNVNYQLTTAKMKEFNKEIKMDDKVYYQSLYTVMKNSFDDLMFFYSYLYLDNAAGDSDGVVSEKSDKWGNYRKIEGGISHAEIVDYKRKKISGIDIPDIYMDIANDLAAKGF